MEAEPSYEAYPDCCCYFCPGGLPLWEKPAQAAAPKLDTIRVALYINADKYKVNTASVTLSADGGLTLGIRTAAGAAPLDTVNGPQAVKASLNGYSVNVLTTGDWAAAQAAGKSTAAAGQSSFIYKNESLGKPVYQVVAGPYVTLAEATAAKATLTSKPEMAAYSAGMSLGGRCTGMPAAFRAKPKPLSRRAPWLRQES
ncbi:SPOR domain-containing protein [Paenibacillus sp. CC-CFT747]|nr:SPOR domain-containing protein [Paenibacillus sp. CC-CFT747]